METIKLNMEQKKIEWKKAKSDKAAVETEESGRSKETERRDKKKEEKIETNIELHERSSQEEKRSDFL